jgi:hypothetical protein
MSNRPGQSGERHCGWTVSSGIVAATVDGIAVADRPFALKMQDDGSITRHVVVRLG